MVHVVYGKYPSPVQSASNSTAEEEEDDEEDDDDDSRSRREGHRGGREGDYGYSPSTVLSSEDDVGGESGGGVDVGSSRPRKGRSTEGLHPALLPYYDRIMSFLASDEQVLEMNVQEKKSLRGDLHKLCASTFSRCLSHETVKKKSKTFVVLKKFPGYQEHDNPSVYGDRPGCGVSRTSQQSKGAREQPPKNGKGKTKGKANGNSGTGKVSADIKDISNESGEEDKSSGGRGKENDQGGGGAVAANTAMATWDTTTGS